MITRVHSAGIPVKDQDAALEFYVNILGWEKRIDAQVDENMRFLTVGTPGAQTEISLVKVDNVADKLSAVTLIADDIQATYDDLTAKGVQFNMPVTDMPWGGRGAEFQDIDGNRFYVEEAQAAE
jgi:predicted enzyme related to lactoylglutathione lyase